jgi:hypothetical protein
VKNALLRKLSDAGLNMKNSALSPEPDGETQSTQVFKKGKWKNFIASHLGGYLHPVIVNGKEINDLSQSQAWELLSMEKDCFVFYEFCKPGKHMYTVNYQDDFYLQKVIIRNRDEPVQNLNKQRQNFTLKQKQFN